MNSIRPASLMLTFLSGVFHKLCMQFSEKSPENVALSHFAMENLVAWGIMLKLLKEGHINILTLKQKGRKRLLM